MEFAILLYNIFLTAVFTLAISCAYYLLYRRKSLAFAGVGLMFMLYMVDNTVVLCTEIIPWFADVYDAMFISMPSFKTIYFVGLLVCVTYVYMSAMKPRSRTPFYFALIVYAILLMCIPFVPESRMMVWLYYLPTQLFLVCLSVCGLVNLRREPQRYDENFYRVFHRLLIFTLIMALAILSEDTLVIFRFDAYGTVHLKINNRSWTENILFIGLALYSIKYTLAVLSSTEVLIFPSPSPTPEVALKPASAFGLAHGLTERECDILVRLLEGDSPQKIGEDLTIAPGTVKTHVHNIYQKMDVAKREQLMAKYQKYMGELSDAHSEE